METRVITNEDFNGRKQFKIYEVDENGEKAIVFDKKTGKKKTKKPIFNFGINKAKILDRHRLHLEDFMESN